MAGAATAEDPPLLLGRQQSLRVDPPQRPSHKTTTNRTEEEGRESSTAPHPCAAYVHYALCNRTMFLSSVTQHARHAHAQVTRETHHMRCTSSHLFSKSTTSSTVLPGAPLRRLVCGRQQSFRVNTHSHSPSLKPCFEATASARSLLPSPASLDRPSSAVTFSRLLMSAPSVSQRLTRR